jgi:hypothetical protein
MKHLIISCLVVVCLCACNNNKKTVEVKSDDGKATVNADVSQAQQVTEEMRKQSEELQKLTPLNLDQLKAILPETIMGAKKSNFQVTSATGTGLATAEYNLNDSTDIQVSVWDCGGPGGAGIYGSRYLTMYNFQSESNNEYTKIIDYKGQKAIEHCQTNTNRCTLTYFTGGRFMVELEGRNMHPDGLKQAAGELNIQS